MNESSNYSLNEVGPEYDAEKLELPDWSGHMQSRRLISKERWLAYCRSNLPKLRAHAGYRRKRLEHGVVSEFRL